MADLSTEYIGLELKNPIIVASSTLVQNFEGVKEAESAGAGAIVLRSLFEEIIRDEIDSHGSQMWSGHPEEYDYVLGELQLQYGPQNYLNLIKQVKSEIKIPLIASINCISPKWWISYAKQIEAAGADAIELNLSLMPTEPAKSSVDIEQEFLSIIKAAREAVKLPLAVKLGPYFTSLSRFANQICGSGINALVLFNRFYQFDIDIEKMTTVGANWYSSPQEMTHSLRWISILYKYVNCELAATTGIHTSQDVIKQILAGAQVVEIASSIYLNGFTVIEKILSELESWMKKQAFQKLSDFRGDMSLSQKKEPEMYERLQYIKALTGISKK
jgi:dihydroorotate dehydrogenase (fumarate)